MRKLICLALLAIALIGAGLFYFGRSRASAPATLDTRRQVEFVFTLYYPHDPPANLLEQAETAVNAQPGPFKWNRSSKLSDEGLFLEIVSASRFAPPKESSLEYFGRGLAPTDAADIQHSTRVLLFHFSCTMPSNFQYAHAAERLVHEVAAGSHGLIWDESTRLLYSPESFNESVLQHWQEELPSLRRDIAVHVYQDGGFLRAISLGMEKFGLPNLVVNQVTGSHSNSAVSLITIIAQEMVEGWPAPPQSPHRADIASLKHRDVKAWIEKSLFAGAAPSALVQLASTPAQDGDPEGPLYELTFEGEVGNTLQERQDTLIARFFGAKDSITSVKHDQAVLELSAKSREKLKLLKPRFLAGLAPGERLLVKGPFVAGEHTEWMWIEVNGWSGDTLAGTLQNDPYYVKSLRAGAPVSVQFDKVFDYLLVHSDHTTEGNETAVLLERQAK